MEQVLFVSNFKNLKYWEEKYSRIYFGSEFCERLIPSDKELKEVLDFTSKKNINFSFVSCYVTDKGIERVKSLFNIFAGLNREIEIIVNDWGVLRLIQKYKLKPVLGRLLSKQKRGPRILNIMKKLPDVMKERFKEASISTYSLNFLKEQGIGRIELDNLLQGISIDKNLYSGLSISLYTPFGYIATTRLCPVISANRKGKSLGIFPCQKECQDDSFILKHSSMPVPLILKGNTVFFENSTIPDHLIDIGINRLVYQPIVPI